MTKEIMFYIVLASIVSAGGIGGIVIGIIKFASDQLAERLSQKYKNKFERELTEYKNSLEKELNKYKTELGKKDYISKARFDTEFQLYKELNKAFMSLVKNISVLIPRGFNWVPADKEAKRKYEEECYKNANMAFIEAQDALYGNSAFIPQTFFDSYEEILKLSRQQLYAFEERYNVLSLETQEEKESFSREDYKRTGTINEQWSALNNSIREYLSKLDVL